MQYQNKGQPAPKMKSKKSKSKAIQIHIGLAYSSCVADVTEERPRASHPF